MSSLTWKPFQLKQLAASDALLEPERTNHFGICWIQAGGGDVCLDAARFPFQEDQLLFLTPYQYVRFECAVPFQAQRILFHANFLCVETFHAETGCSGPLFNDPYQLPLITLTRSQRSQVRTLFQHLAQEQQQQQLGYEEAQLLSTKLLLIHAARWKGVTGSGPRQEFRDPVITALRDLIEQHYCQLHAPADYARCLHMTTKSLGRHVREQLGKTLTELVRQRILTHAKWELLHTLRPVKEIAAEVGFQDELYFSRLFKKATGLSPTGFREYETEIRGGSNLSM